MRQHYKIPLLAGIGGMLEFYDFIVFALFYPQIQQAFFAQISHPFLQLLTFFLAFSAAYIVRPMGGLIAGWFGDRYGRKVTFTATIMVMAICVLAMGLLPSYAQIGWSAPIILLLLRVIQGLAVGGELAGAIVYVFESFHDQIGLALGILYAMITLGNVLGNLVHLGLMSFLPESIAWRGAFIFGSLVAIIGYIVRRKLHETPAFEKIQSLPRKSFKSMLYSNRWTMIGMILCVIPAAFNGVVTMLYMANYLQDTLHYPHTSDLMLALALLNVTILFISSYISDYINYLKAFRLWCVMMIICGFVGIYLIEYSPIIGTIILMLPVSVICGWYLRMLCEAFVTRFRYSGVALTYNIGFAVVGALAPITIQSLLTLHIGQYAVAWVCALCATMGLIGVGMIKCKPCSLLS